MVKVEQIEAVNGTTFSTTPTVTMFVENDQMGVGNLIINEERLIWQKEDNQGVSLDYREVSICAVARDRSSFPHDCLYLLVEGTFETAGSTQPENNHQSDEDDDDDHDHDDHPSFFTVRFVPTNSVLLDDLYTWITKCQALHPDPNDSNLEDDDDDDHGHDDHGHVDQAANGYDEYNQYFDEEGQLACHGGDVDMDEELNNGTNNQDNQNSDDQFMDAD